MGSNVFTLIGIWNEAKTSIVYRSIFVKHMTVIMIAVYVVVVPRVETVEIRYCYEGE
jgi:hypothetical protein